MCLLLEKVIHLSPQCCVNFRIKHLERVLMPPLAIIHDMQVTSNCFNVLTQFQDHIHHPSSAGLCINPPFRYLNILLNLATPHVDTSFNCFGSLLLVILATQLSCPPCACYFVSYSATITILLLLYLGCCTAVSYICSESVTRTVDTSNPSASNLATLRKS